MKIMLQDIQPSKTNPRKHFDEKSLGELVDSLKYKGLQYPITIRNTPDRKNYELVDGERRFIAAKMAGWTQIEAIIRDMTDEEAKEAQIISFEQDEDIHPLDKAEALIRLFPPHKPHDPDAIARTIGKPISYVEKQLRLLMLIEPAKKAFRADVLTLGHAILICRLQPADQKRAFEFAVKSWQEFDSDYDYQNRLNPDASDEKFGYRVEANTVCSVNDLRVFIEARINLDLKQAAFDVKDAQLLPKAGSCIDCPKRTGFNKELFNDIGKGDFCTDASCFHAKQAAFTERLKSGLKKDKRKYQEITRDQRKPDGHPGAMTERSFKYVKGKPCKFTRVGIFIDADSKGKTALICSAKKECKQHFSEEMKHKKDNGMGNREPKIDYAAEERKRKIAKEKGIKRFRALAIELWKKIPSTIDFKDKKIINALAKAFKGEIDIDLRNNKPKDLKLDNIQIINAGLLCQKYHFNVGWEGKIDPGIYEACKELGIKPEPILQKITEEEKAEENKPEKGTCRVCGCTEDHACTLKPEGDKPIRPCSWADKSETLCNNPKCLEAVRKQSAARKAAKKPAKKAPKKAKK